MGEEADIQLEPECVYNSRDVVAIIIAMDDENMVRDLLV